MTHIKSRYVLLWEQYLRAYRILDTKEQRVTEDCYELSVAKKIKERLNKEDRENNV